MSENLGPSMAQSRAADSRRVTVCVALGVAAMAAGIVGSSNQATAAATIIEARITRGADDAEETNATGAVSLASSDIELTVDGSNQTVGLRYSDISIPRGATITSAYIQFVTDEVKTATSKLTINAQTHDNAPTFTTAKKNITARTRTSAKVVWSPGPWPTIGQAGANQRTPDLASVVSEVTSRPGWASGSAIAFVITGTGTRTAQAYEAKPTNSPLLHIEYVSAPAPTTTTTATTTTLAASTTTLATTTTTVATTTTLTATTTTPVSTLPPDPADRDSDGVVDSFDNCPTIANPTQADANANGIGDACEAALGANVLFAAGDLTDCSKTTDDAVAAMLSTRPGTILTLGDNAYTQGSAENFANCFDPLYGSMKSRIRPGIGNHDVDYTGGGPYFDYFGPSAGEPGKGYYSYDVAGWHIVSLNTNCALLTDGCDVGSTQERWLRADLAAHPAQCTLAYWHHPMFATGYAGNNSKGKALWQALADYHAEIVLSGHSHTYERFAPQTANAIADPNHGIREFVVGTGGHSHYVKETTKANSEVFDNTSFGALKLTLNSGSYSWEFLKTTGTLTDSGTASCHS